MISTHIPTPPSPLFHTQGAARVAVSPGPQSAEQLRQAMEHAQAVINTTLVPMANIAFTYVTLATDLIKERGLWRHLVKKRGNEALKAFDAFFDFLEVESPPHMRDAFSSFLDVRYASVEALIKSPNPLHIDRDKPMPLYEALKAAIFDQGEDDIEFHAKMELAMALTDIVVGLYDKLNKSLRENAGFTMTGHKIRQYRGSAQAWSFGLVCDLVCHYKHGVGFRTDSRVVKAYETLCLAIFDMDAVDEDASVAMDKNPDFKAEEMRRLQTGQARRDFAEAVKSGGVLRVVVSAKTLDALLSGERGYIVPSRQTLASLAKRTYTHLLLRAGVASKKQYAFPIRKNGKAKLRLGEVVL